MGTLKMGPHARAKYDFMGSMYRKGCPKCGAAPFEWCVVRSGKCFAQCHAARQNSTGCKPFHRKVKP